MLKAFAIVGAVHVAVQVLILGVGAFSDVRPNCRKNDFAFHAGRTIRDWWIADGEQNQDQAVGKRQ